MPKEQLRQAEATVARGGEPENVVRVGNGLDHKKYTITHPDGEPGNFEETIELPEGPKPADG